MDQETAQRLREQWEDVERRSGWNIAMLRGLYRMEQQELARLVGVSKQSIGAIESGKTKTPSYPVASRLAEVFGIPVNVLVEGSPSEVLAAAAESYEARIPEVTLNVDHAAFGNVTQLPKARKSRSK